MAGYAILGGGEVSKTYLLDTLKKLKEAAQAADEEFFLILPYELTVKDGDDMVLTDTMADLYEWVEEDEVWARVFAAKEEPEDEQPAVEEFNVVGKKESVAQAVLKDVINEGGELLVLTWTQDWDEVDKRDAEVLDAIVAANQNGVTVRQLNNGMIELDLTESEEEPNEGPDEEGVRSLGVEADEGNEDAAATLTELAAEYGLDITAEPYDTMTWTDFAEALIVADAEQANAEAPQAPAESQPQAHDRAELEAKQVRSLRSMAIAEGWGKSGQAFPKWFLVKHLAEGTVPTKAQLDGKEQVPEEEPTDAPEAAQDAPEAPKQGRGRSKSTGVVSDGLGATQRAGLINVANHLAAAADALRAWAGENG